MNKLITRKAGVTMLLCDKVSSKAKTLLATKNFDKRMNLPRRQNDPKCIHIQYLKLQETKTDKHERRNRQICNNSG